MNLNRIVKTVFISSTIVACSFFQAENASAASRTFNWPTWSDGTKIAGDMNTFRKLSNNKTRDIIADRYCQYKGYKYHTNWGTVFRDWSQRENLTQIHEDYDNNRLEYGWYHHEGGYMFSSITCYR